MDGALEATRGVHNVEGRTWDKDEVLRRALERDDRERGAEGQRRLIEEGGPGGAGRFLEARERAIDFSKDVGKRKAVSAEAVGAAKAGYHCQACERTFHDSGLYLAHLNSAQHLARLGQSAAVRKATLGEVRERLRQCILEKYGLRGAQKDSRSFRERVADLEKEEAARKEQDAASRKQRKELRRAAKRAAAAAAEGEGEGEDGAVLAAMGFGSFGGAKKARRR